MLELLLWFGSCDRKGCRGMNTAVTTWVVSHHIAVDLHISLTMPRNASLLKYIVMKTLMSTFMWGLFLWRTSEILFPRSSVIHLYLPSLNEPYFKSLQKLETGMSVLI